MKDKKIVLIGAGSRCFGPRMIVDILNTKELQGKNFTLTLVDEDLTALDLAAKLAHRVKKHTGTDIAIEKSQDRLTALPNATYVITSVAKNRMALWEQDFRVPLSYGFKHCLGENGGPGALFHALRSFELVIPICRDIEKICPQALLLNFTNPEARVLNAICHLTKVKAVGICHGVFSAIQLICDLLGRPREELQIISAGMNHLYCMLKIIDKKTGKDLLADVLNKIKSDTSVKLPPLVRKMAEIFDIITYASDDHIGEYLSYAWEFTGTKWHYGQECKKVSKDNKEEPSLLEIYSNEANPLEGDIMLPSGEITVPIICDIELNRPSFREAVNVLNTERYIENLPTDAVIEVPAMVDGSGIHPMKVGPIPESFACYIRTHFTVHKFLTEAYRTKSKKMLLRALLMDPNVNSITAAEKMLDDMLDLQKEFLPTFS
ncbi:MAG: alpha-glucosidase/alpha-galactosidase [Phycisphaerae bacterium]